MNLNFKVPPILVIGLLTIGMAAVFDANPSYYQLAQVSETVQPVAETAPASAPASEPEHVEPEDEGPQRPPIDQEEIRNFKQNTRDMERDARRLSKQAQKAGAAELVEKLTVIFNQVTSAKNDFAAAGGDLEKVGEVIHEYWELNLWDDLNPIRWALELPQRIKELTRSLARLEKTLKTKWVVKLALDLSPVQAYATEARTSLNEAQTAFNANDYEEADQALQVLNEGHPGSWEGALQAIKELQQMARKAKKNQSLKDMVAEALQSTIASFNAGEPDQIHEIVNPVRDEFYKTCQRSC